MRGRGKVVAVISDTLLTIPEVARRLGLPGGEVYRLIFSGQLAGSPTEDGAVRVAEEAVRAFAAERHANVPRAADH